VVEVEFDFELGRGKLIGGLCAAELLNDAVGFFGDFFQDFLINNIKVVLRLLDLSIEYKN